MLDKRTDKRTKTVRASIASKCILKYFSQAWPARLIMRGRLAYNQKQISDNYLLDYIYVHLTK